MTKFTDKQKAEVFRFLASDSLQFNASVGLRKKLVEQYDDLFHLDQRKRCNFSDQQEKQHFRYSLQRDGLLTPSDNNADRVSIARHQRNEKAGSKGPQQDYILAAGELLPVAGQDIDVPADCSLRLPWHSLDCARIRQLMVIENLAVFNHWQQVAALIGESDMLFVYRGHGSDASAVMALLEALPDDCAKTAFCDYDPKGLEIALCNPHHTHLVIPQLNPSLLQQWNQADKFLDQIEAQSFLRNRRFSPSVQHHVDFLLSHHVAFMQEHVLAHKVPLQKISITSTDQ